MTLSTGTKLSHYEITSQIGKGGMGEVYQAKDQKLGRDVAIKVLPEEFARDSDRVARFQREAKLLASLNHPNIAAIYGLEESDGTHFLVMELIEGQTLDDQIKSGAIPVEESLKLALQIAEALEAAHEKGVIHRDLKPANIKVTPDGKVKVLDFGLAKAFAGEQADLNLSNSPTLSVAATLQGVILGTAAYMSPEQAKGKSVDKRADIWAFGAVLFEMLTGKPAFPGDDISEILASVIKGDSNLALLPKNIHARVRELLNRCLQKDLRKRYADIADARYEIEQVLADPGGVWVQPKMEGESLKKLKFGLPWVAVITALGIIIAVATVWRLKPPESKRVTKFDFELPAGQQLGSLNERAFDISPDGRQIVYKTEDGLYLRSLDEMKPRLIPGTEDNPQKPFFSPDGKWIGYISGADGKLKKISVKGGMAVPIADVNSTGFFSWGENDSIVYADGESIWRISAKGGDPKLLFKSNEICISPQVLNDGKTVMYTAGSSPMKIILQPLESGDRKELFPGDTARYLPTGHIIYAVETSLYIIPFDDERLEPKGYPVLMAQGVLRSGGAPQYAVSDSGTLVYVPETFAASAIQRTLVLVDRDGNEEPISAPPDNYRQPALSPDGKKLAIVIGPTLGCDIWIWDLVREAFDTRLTSSGEINVNPLWSLDGKRIVFTSFQEGKLGLFWKSADGTDEVESFFSLPGISLEIFANSWAEDGNILLLQEQQGGQVDIGILSLKNERNRKPLLQNSYYEGQPRMSPDGHWIAYSSDEAGRREIYVRPYPDINKTRHTISTSGGDNPLWSLDGGELYYRKGNSVMAVSIETEPEFNARKPTVLFSGEYITTAQGDIPPWCMHPDGRFLMIKPTPSKDGESENLGPRKINVVLNWFEELKQKVPVD
jgi:serine/threonine protein kinase